MTLEELIDSYLHATGQPAKLHIDNGTAHAKILYTVLLENDNQTQKDIVSTDLYDIGDMILDMETGMHGKIVRREPYKSREARPL